MSEANSGWYSDPRGSYLYRYWNGTQWTNQISNGGTHSGLDPDPLAPGMITTPPAPGTAAPSVTPPPQPTVQVTQSRGSSVGTIIAIILAVAAIILVIVLITNSDDSSTEDTQPPATTEAPATTESG
jgi:hypothetical protein